MKKLILIALVCIAWACQPNKETETVSTVPTLTLKWKTDTLLTTVESVIYMKYMMCFTPPTSTVCLMPKTATALAPKFPVLSGLPT